MGMERQGDEDEAGAARRSGAEAEAPGTGTWHGDSSTQGVAAAGWSHAGGGAATCAGEYREAGQRRDLMRLRRGKKTVGGGGA